MNRGEDILVDGLREMVAQQQADDLARKGRITQDPFSFFERRASGCLKGA
jgi:hypothetical protein